MTTQGPLSTPDRLTPDRLEPVRIRCRTCGAQVSVAAERLTATCPYCDSPAVVERPASADRPDPEFALPFIVERERAAAQVRAFVRRKWFAPKGLAQAAFEHVRGVYVPAYLYNAVAHSEWEAQIGEDYTEVEQVRVRDARGNWTTRTRTVVRTEHHHLRGRFATYLVDVVVSASRGVPNDELEALEPFDLRALVRFSPALVSGWIAEEPQLERAACLSTAQVEARTVVGQRLRSFMPGDSHHGLEHQTAFSDEALDLALLPVWVFALRHGSGADPVRLVVNGRTGAVHGKLPHAWLKIAGFSVAVLLALCLAFLVALAIAAALGAR